MTAKDFLSISAGVSMILISIGYVAGNTARWKAACGPVATVSNENLEELRPLDPTSELALEVADKPRVPSATQPVAAAGPLEAPSEARPNQRADVRDHRPLRLHWQAVEGAASYRVSAWQLQGPAKVMLVDEDIYETEVRIELRGTSAVHWQVAAVDPSGRPGRAAGPFKVEILATGKK